MLTSYMQLGAHEVCSVEMTHPGYSQYDLILHLAYGACGPGLQEGAKLFPFPKMRTNGRNARPSLQRLKKDYVHHLSSFIMSRQGYGCIQGGVCASFYL